jgi:2-dehydro-3-deoxyphosphogluconate aldolase / (4S)-4-hydroxy-2-oxoglutarate aldolase
MAKFTQTQLLEKLAERPIMPLFYHADVDFALEVLQASYNGGVRVFEYTNRGQGADKVFEKLVQKTRSQMPEMAIGIGTIYNAEQARAFAALDTDFIIQPFIDEGVATVCAQLDLAWVPGTMTFSEIHRAEDLGSQMVKLFPGNIVGPDFLKAMKGPMPHTKVLVTGGVEPNGSNLNMWKSAGAYALGLGSQLFSTEALNAKDFKSIENKLKQCFEALA